MKKAILIMGMAFVASCSRSQGTKPETVECTPIGENCASSCDARGLQTIADATPKRTQAPDASRLRIALAVTTAWPRTGTWKHQDAFQQFVDRSIRDTRKIFDPCGVSLDVVRAELIAAPTRFLNIVANTPDSWAGLAPAGKDAAQFNYDLNERLVPDVAEVFGFARRGLPDGVISVVALDRIEYYAAKKRTVAGGLAFPPVLYHAENDFPARNGVLVASAYPTCGSLPARLNHRVIAHELGHMVLNLASHDPDPKNLMHSATGTALRKEQCAKMREHLSTLFGNNAVSDPGRPQPVPAYMREPAQLRRPSPH